MLKLTERQLTQQQPVIQQLILRSFESEVYLVELKLADGIYHYCDAEGKPQIFRSQLAAKIPFKGLGINDTVLIHNSPYNEMIGLEVAQVEPLSVPISNPDQDYS